MGNSPRTSQWELGQPPQNGQVVSPRPRLPTTESFLKWPLGWWMLTWPSPWAPFADASQPA